MTTRRALRPWSRLALVGLLSPGCELLEQVDPPPVGGLEVSGELTTSTTWSVDRCPVLVTGDVFVEGDASPVLTIEAGCEVRFAPDAGLHVSYFGKPGALVVAGTAAAPVRFVPSGDRAPGAWSAIRFSPAASGARSRISHAVLEGGGGGEAGALVLDGARVPLDHVTIRGSGSDGVQVRGDGALGEGSTDLAITGSAGFGVRVPAGAAHTVPEAGAALAGNAAGAVGVEGGEVVASAAWGAVGGAYEVLGDVFVEGDASPVLTLEAGVELRMAAGASLHASYFGKAGALRATGTAERPVRIGGRDQRGPGAWGSLEFRPSSLDGQNLLEHVELRDGGGEGSERCVVIEEAAVTVRHVRVSGCAGAGLRLEGEKARFGQGSTALEVSGAATFGVSVEAPGVASVPVEGSSYAGNGAGGVEVRGGTVVDSGTWSPVPGDLVISGDVFVEGPARPVLTVAPGAVLRFRAGAGLSVSYFGEAGGLAARGTAERPVTFTAADQSAPGAWRSIRFGAESIDASSALEHAVVEWGGEGEVPMIDVDGAAPALRDLVIRGSAGCGVRFTCSGGPAARPVDVTYGEGAAANRGGDLCDDCT